jgi:hypothetical protein
LKKVRGTVAKASIAKILMHFLGIPVVPASRDNCGGINFTQRPPASAERSTDADGFVKRFLRYAGLLIDFEPKV